MEAPQEKPTTENRGVLTRVAKILASVPFASSVVAAIAVACIVGTLLPQGSQVQQYLGKNPDAKGLMSLLDVAGLTHVYSAWWFIGLLLLLSASLAICSFRRYLAAMRQTGRPRGRAFGSLITHISMLLVLGGGVVRTIWGERGQIAFYEGETVQTFVVNGQRTDLPFSIHLVDFEIEFYDAKENESLLIHWADREQHWSTPVLINETSTFVPKGEDSNPENTFAVQILRRVPDFVIDSSTGAIASRSDQLRNPAVQVEVIHQNSTNTQWVFALRPGFDMHGPNPSAKLEFQYHVQAAVLERQMVKDYRSTLQIIENDTVVKAKTIEVNAPLSYKGYTFYQSGYNAKDPTWTSLQVVKDPGVPLVYTGFLLMILGLITVFYLYPHGRHGE
jgi:cytochrome c biogenesis protein ResB